MHNKTSPLFLTPEITMTRGPGRVYYLESSTPLRPGPQSLLGYLEKWVRERPDTVFLAERNKGVDGSWTSISYGEFYRRACRLAAALSTFDVAVDKPLMLVSGNSIANALMTFSGYLLGIPVVPVSPSYSLLSRRYEKVHYIQELTGAQTVFAENTSEFSGVLQAMQAKGLRVITADRDGKTMGATWLEELLALPLPDIQPVQISADTVAKIMFTSGSTGMPKGVINTHGMLVSNQEAIATIWPFIEERGHVFLDWLPWHHTFGGNHNLNMVLRNGATLYIDNGKPTPDGIRVTVENIKTVAPTLSFNVAAGYDLLAGELERDPVAAKRFFSNLRMIFFAAAALPGSIRKRLEALIECYAERTIPITSSWGQTETSPLSTSVYFDSCVPNNIGVPIPGTKIKLAPVGDMLELRVKGPNVMPGYFKDPEKTAEVFDDEGYLCSGDAAEIFDLDRPEQGLVFKGRVSENFKLLSGSWVNVGELRLELVAALSPLATDFVICGHNEKSIAVLIFPNVQACQEFLGNKVVGDALVSAPRLQAEIAQRLSRHNSRNSASTRRVNKALLQGEPPSFEKNEITDKGYLNQRGVLQNREGAVRRLYSDETAGDIILVE